MYIYVYIYTHIYVYHKDSEVALCLNSSALMGVKS